jgi:hypothetical protein
VAETAETAAEAAARLAEDAARTADAARRFEHIAAQTNHRFPDLKTGIEDVRKRSEEVWGFKPAFADGEIPAGGHIFDMSMPDPPSGGGVSIKGPVKEEMADEVINGAKEIISEIKHKPSSGAVLKTTPGKTTTILGRFDVDMRPVVKELGDVKSVDFGARNGGFNVLNVPDGLYKTADQFWEQYNKPWLGNAIKRGDDIILATKPEKGQMFKINAITGKEELTGFGKEYEYLVKNGYVYDETTHMMVLKK